MAKDPKPEWLMPKLGTPHKIIRIWKIKAFNRWDAGERFRKLEEQNRLGELETETFAVEDKPKGGWWSSLVKQVLG